MKRLVISTIVVLTTLGALILVWQFRLALGLFVLSLVVAAAVRPAADFWVQRGLPRGLAILLTYLIGLGLLGGLFLLISRPLVSELERATNNFVITYERITLTWPEGTSFQQAVASQLPPVEELFQEIAGDRGAMLLQTTLGIAQSFFGLVGQVVIVLVLSIYWSVDRVRSERLWLSVLPAGKRTRAREIWQEIETGVGAYVRSEFIQSLLAGILLGTGYWLIGLPYPVLLALSGALLWLIPWMGAVLAVIIPLFVGLNQGLWQGAAAALFTLAVLLVLEVLVEPRLFNRRRYSSLLIVLFVVALADAYGLLGLIIAPPFAAATQMLFRNLMQVPAPAQPVDVKVQVANLQARLLKVKEMIAGPSGTAGQPELTNLVERIDHLIRETEDFVRAEEEGGEPTLGLPVTAETTR